MTAKKYRVSATRLKTWLSCPLSFRLDQDLEPDRQRDDPSTNLAAQRGTLIHAALEEVCITIGATTETGTVRAADVLAELGKVAARKADKFSGEAIAEAAELVRNMRPRAIGRVIGVERKIRARFSADESIPPLVATIDLISEDTGPAGTVLRLIDWKSSRYAPPKSEAETDPQVVLYLAAARRLVDAGSDDFGGIKPDVIRFELIYPAINRRTVVEWSPELDAYAEALWIHGAPRAARGEGEAKLGRQCGWCSHRWHCPAFASALTDDLGDTEARITAELAELETDDLIALTEMAKGRAKATETIAKDLTTALEARIREACEPLEADGRRAKLVTTRRRILYLTEFLDGCEDIGLDPLAVLRAANPSLSVPAVEALLDESQRAALEPYLDAKVSQYVSFSKAKKGKAK